MAASLLSVLLSLAPASQAAPSVPPPPITVSPVAAGERKIVLWRAGTATCGGKGGAGKAIQSAMLIEPDPHPALRTEVPAPVTLTFALDPEGRPFDIRSDAQQAYRVEARDFMPALRASRFANAADAKDGCKITYTASVTTLDETDLATLARFGAVPRQQLNLSAWQRIAPGNCRDNPRLAPQLRAYPDWRKIAARPGTRTWSYVRYDVDSAGKPVNIATAVSAGDPALDAEVRAAISQSRFAGGPRTGCAAVLWRDPATIPAPAIPPTPAYSGNPECEIDNPWARPPQLIYPKSYRQRAIEGWAILRYDVAPWGEIGSITVLEAQPSAEFGDAAMNVLRNARFKPLAGGASGCVGRIIFQMPPEGEGAAEEQAAPIAS